MGILAQAVWQVVTLLVHLLTRSKPRSRNHVFWLWLTPVLTINLSRRHLMLTSLLLPLPMLILLPSLSTLPSHATTRETSLSDLCGGFWPAKSCVSLAQFLVNSHGMLCRICFSIAIPKRPKKKNKLAKRLWPLKLLLLLLAKLMIKLGAVKK